jgi:signal transduction histidine kinase
MYLLRTLLILAAVLTAITGRADLLVHLPFDSNGEDVSGHQNHAVAGKGATFDRVNFKLGGGAAGLAGTNYFSIPNFAPAVGNGARSVSFWERSTATNAGSVNEIFMGWGDPGGAAGTRYDVCLQNKDNTRLRIEFNISYVVSSTNTVNFRDGAWHQIVVTYDTIMVRYFVDGIIYGEGQKPPVKLKTGGREAGTIIGCGVRQVEHEMASGRRFFTGQIDDVGMWNTDLSAADAVLINGLGRVGDNDLRWLEIAQALWGRKFGSTAKINGHTWKKVLKLPGEAGTWLRVGGPNGTGSFIVIDDSGGGIQIVSRWWEQDWVWMSGLLGGLLGIAVMVVWSVERLRLQGRLRQMELQATRENERRRIAQDLHDDLGSGLTEIFQLGDFSAQDCSSIEALRHRVKIITQKTRAMVAAVDEIVWTANPRNDAIPNLAGYLSDHAQEFFSVSPIRCRLDVAGEIPGTPVAAADRHHCFLGFKEALNNAAKHSGATEVWVRIRCEPGWLKVLVEDNGRGFDLNTVSAGNGLANMKHRFQELGGRVTITSRPGQGTTVEFLLPLQETAAG